MANTRLSRLFSLGLIIAVCCSPIFSTAQLIDDFSDRNLNTDPEWMGTLSHFIINDNLQLQLNAESVGFSYLSTHAQFPDFCEWQFYLKLAFSPSANNNCRIYLMSDQQDLESENLLAYYLQFGESGSNDAIELFYQNGDEIQSVCRGNDASISSAFEYYVKVRRFENGEWQISTSKPGDPIYTYEAFGESEAYFGGGYFGIKCKYTSSNKTKFYFDDIYVGEPLIDSIPPELKSIEVVQSNQLELSFSEPVSIESLNKCENYLVDQGIGHSSFLQIDDDQEKVNLIFDQCFVESQPYNLFIENISDLNGNIINPIQKEFTYFKLQAYDLVINEVLFDPFNGCEEFVEIYNRSQKTFNLSKLLFGRIKNDFPQPPDTSICQISDTSIYIKPSEYWLLTKDAESISGFYNLEYPEWVVEVSDMPALLNEEGHLFLVSDSGIFIDQMKYTEDMHHPFLNFTDGIALEKIHPDAWGLNESSWQSASENSGFGTPTAQNSQFTQINASNQKVSLSPKVFSPDQDGFDDILSISLDLQNTENTLNIYVYNSLGQRINHLAKNRIIGQKEIIYWDGTDENNSIQMPGHYIILIEVFDLNGNKEQFKHICVLARKI